MHPEVVLFRKGLRAVRAFVLRLPHVDHLGVLVQVTFLREPHVADLAFEGFLFGVGPKVVEKLAHRKYGERAGAPGLVVCVLAFKKLKKPPLQMGSQKVVDAEVLCVRDVD